MPPYCETAFLTPLGDASNAGIQPVEIQASGMLEGMNYATQYFGYQ